MKTYKETSANGKVVSNICIIGDKAYICQIVESNGQAMYFEQSVNAKTGKPWQAQRNLKGFPQQPSKAMVYWLKQVRAAQK